MADVKDVYLFFSLSLALSLSLLFLFFSSASQIRVTASATQFTSCQHNVMFVEQKGIQGERDGHPELQWAALLRKKKKEKKKKERKKTSSQAFAGMFESAALQPGLSE